MINDDDDLTWVAGITTRWRDVRRRRGAIGPDPTKKITVGTLI